MNWVKAIPLLVLTVGLWISWIILLAGVSAALSQCGDSFGSNCSERLSFEWWITWFAFVVLWVASLGSCVPAMFRLRKVTLYMFLLLTAIMMVDASKIYDSIYLNGVGDDDYRKRLKVYFAGLIMFLIGDFLWIIYAGLMDGREGDDHQSSGGHFDPRSPTPAGYPNYGATKAGASPARATGGIPVSPTPGAGPWTPGQGTQYVASPEPGMTYSPGGVTSHTVAYAQGPQGPGANV